MSGFFFGFKFGLGFLAALASVGAVTWLVIEARRRTLLSKAWAAIVKRRMMIELAAFVLFLGFVGAGITAYAQNRECVELANLAADQRTARMEAAEANLDKCRASDSYQRYVEAEFAKTVESEEKLWAFLSDRGDKARTAQRGIEAFRRSLESDALRAHSDPCRDQVISVRQASTPTHWGCGRHPRWWYQLTGHSF